MNGNEQAAMHFYRKELHVIPEFIQKMKIESKKTKSLIFVPLVEVEVKV
jgi:hypothetical protein